MKIDENTKELIAVGAAIVANSQPSLEYHAKIALDEGSNAEEIAEAIEVGKRVRKGVATRLDVFISARAKSASCHQSTEAWSSGCCS